MDLCLYINEYKDKPMHNLYRIFKKAKVYIFVLNAYDQKVRYKVFKYFQTLVTTKQNTYPQFYKVLLYKNQFFQFSLFYQNRKKLIVITNTLTTEKICINPKDSQKFFYHVLKY